MTLKYYDKTFYIPCLIDASGLKQQDREAIVDFLSSKLQTFVITYPSVHAMEVSLNMSRKGHPNMAKLPYRMSNDEAVELFLNCMWKINPNAQPRITPTAARLQKNVSKAADLERIVDELTGQQDGIALSQILQLANRPSIGISLSPTFLNARIARNVIDLGSDFIGKRKFEPTMEELLIGIQDALNKAREEEERLRVEAKYSPNFR